MFCFIKKSHESKQGHPPSYFYKKHCERKMKNIFVSSHSYNSDIKSSGGNIYGTTSKGPKMVWVPNVKT